MTRPLWVWLAGVSRDAVPGTEHHLVRRLAVHVDLLWVDPARSLLRGRPHRSPEQVAPGVWQVAPAAPPAPYRPGVAPATALLADRAVRAAVQHLGRSASLVVGTSPHPRLGVLGPGVPRIYYATDDFVAGASLMGTRPGRFAAFERRRVAEADALAAVSPDLLARWGTGDRPTLWLPNGADVEHYAEVDRAPLPPEVTLPGPVSGVVGQLSSRIDPALLEAVVDAGASLLLVGPLLPDFGTPGLLDRPGVQWVGQQDFAALPSYLRRIDVGLVPYTESGFNRASFPLKVLEYLAAGRDVVSTPLPAVERLATDLVRTARGPEAFAAATTAALAAAATPGQAENRAARRAFAARHSWSARAGDLLALAARLSAAGR